MKENGTAAVASAVERVTDEEVAELAAAMRANTDAQAAARDTAAVLTYVMRRLAVKYRLADNDRISADDGTIIRVAVSAGS